VSGHPVHKTIASSPFDAGAFRAFETDDCAQNKNYDPKSVLTAVLTRMALFDGIQDPRWYSGENQ